VCKITKYCGKDILALCDSAIDQLMDRPQNCAVLLKNNKLTTYPIIKFKSRFKPSHRDTLKWFKLVSRENFHKDIININV
jgi:hypothetical protein